MCNTIRSIIAATTDQGNRIPHERTNFPTRHYPLVRWGHAVMDAGVPSRPREASLRYLGFEALGTIHFKVFQIAAAKLVPCSKHDNQRLLDRVWDYTSPGAPLFVIEPSYSLQMGGLLIRVKSWRLLTCLNKWDCDFFHSKQWVVH